MNLVIFLQIVAYYVQQFYNLLTFRIKFSNEGMKIQQLSSMPGNAKQKFGRRWVWWGLCKAILVISLDQVS